MSPIVRLGAFAALAIVVPAAHADGAEAPKPDEPPAVVAAPAIPKDRLVLNDVTVLRYNPLGLENQIRVGYQRRMFDSDSVLFRDTFVFVGLFPKLNPAFVRIGPGIEIQPIAAFNLRVVAEYVGYFSTFGFVQSFASPLEEYSDTKLYEERGKTNYATSGLHVSIEPLLQAKFGPIAVRNKFAIEYWNLAVRSGTVFYEMTADTLIPAKGLMLTNDLDVIYVPGSGLVVGARWSAVWPLYAPGDFRPGEDAASARNSHHRVGIIGAYTFFDEGFTRFNKPTVLAILSWYVDHRYRTGADVSRAIPYVILGFAFQSDLL